MYIFIYHYDSFQMFPMFLYIVLLYDSVSQSVSRPSPATSTNQPPALLFELHRAMLQRQTRLIDGAQPPRIPRHGYRISRGTVHQKKTCHFWDVQGTSNKFFFVCCRAQEVYYHILYYLNLCHTKAVAPPLCYPGIVTLPVVNFCGEFVHPLLDLWWSKLQSEPFLQRPDGPREVEDLCQL